MLKNVLKLNGVQKLNKNEQKSINGGGFGPCSWAPSGVTEEQCQVYQGFWIEGRCKICAL